MSAAGAGDGGLYSPCARHGDAAAAYRCCACGESLCADCVEIGSHLVSCRLCGERAIELDEWERPVPGESPDLRRRPPGPVGQSAGAAPAAGYRRPARNPGLRPEAAQDDWAGDASLFLVNHAVIPAATIAMVSALLFFLLDVRSVFLSGTEALKWVGFWFVTGTVLIARYGRTSSNAERQGCYTSALGAATLVVMTVSPWANPAGGFAGTMANLLIVLAVWRFATRLTRGLSLEGGLGKEPEPRLFGLERRQLEEWHRARGEGRPAPRGAGDPKKDAGGNPGAPVARLAALGLLAFALGEPFLLSGPPATGERALGTMIVFLLAAGVVLAAGSGLGTLHRVRSLGGQGSLATLPGRIASAAMAMVLLLAIALAMPGIEVRGTGERRSQPVETGREGGEDRGATEEPSGTADSRPAEDSSRGFSRAAVSVVRQLAELGKWVRYLVVLAAAVLALWGLWRLLHQPGSTRRWLIAALGDLFRRLFAGVRGLFPRRTKKNPAPRRDPFADWDTLRQLEPREAVLAAYGRLLAVFEQLQHPRPERHTPYEFLASIPTRLKRLGDPARSLTEVYVKAAYSGAAVEAADRLGALAALEEVERLIGESRQ